MPKKKRKMDLRKMSHLSPVPKVVEPVHRLCPLMHPPTKEPHASPELVDIEGVTNLRG
jgi:hypothetical protein